MAQNIAECGTCGETNFCNWYGKDAPKDRHGRIDRDYMDSKPVAYCSEECRDAADAVPTTPEDTMTDQTITTIPYSENATLTYDLPNGAPDVTSGSDVLAPTRITIKYSQHASFAFPQVIEVTIKGLIRNPDGTLSSLSNTAEVWRYAATENRPAWVAAMINENLPAWWNA